MAYLVFAGDNWYPTAAFGDYKGTFTDLEEIAKFISVNSGSTGWYQGKLYWKNESNDWIEIVELNEKCELLSSTPVYVKNGVWIKYKVNVKEMDV